MPEPSCEKNSDSSTTVAKSATVAPVITSWPNAVRVSPASLSTATTIPKAVAASTIPTSSGDSTSPAASSTWATAIASRSDTPNARRMSPMSRSSSV